MSRKLFMSSLIGFTALSITLPAFAQSGSDLDFSSHVDEIALLAVMNLTAEPAAPSVTSAVQVKRFLTEEFPGFGPDIVDGVCSKLFQKHEAVGKMTQGERKRWLQGRYAFASNDSFSYSRVSPTGLPAPVQLCRHPPPIL